MFKHKPRSKNINYVIGIFELKSVKDKCIKAKIYGKDIYLNALLKVK